jgi:hypothetical protein
LRNGGKETEGKRHREDTEGKGKVGEKEEGGGGRGEK